MLNIHKLFIKKTLFAFIILLIFFLPVIVGAEVQLADPLALGDNPIPALANRFITAALGISGVLALVAFIYGGLLYLTAGVNPKFVEKGKELMKYAVIGLFVIFSSYAIINFVMKTVLQVPAGGNETSAVGQEMGGVV